MDLGAIHELCSWLQGVDTTIPEICPGWMLLIVTHRQYTGHCTGDSIIGAIARGSYSLWGMCKLNMASYRQMVCSVSNPFPRVPGQPQGGGVIVWSRVWLGGILFGWKRGCVCGCLGECEWMETCLSFRMGGPGSGDMCGCVCRWVVCIGFSRLHRWLAGQLLGWVVGSVVGFFLEVVFGLC